jgi:hypothetical protein
MTLGRVSVRGARRAGGSLVDAVSSLYGQAVDRMLAAPERIASAAEGKALLSSDESTEAMTDQVQKVVVLAVPLLRTVARGARFTRVPWVLVASTAVSVGVAVRTGVREVQVLGSLVAGRIEEETGEPADPTLVKKITIELYLSPGRLPDLSDRRLPLGRLIRRWILGGALGRATGKTAVKSLDAAERLDVRAVVTRWDGLDAAHSSRDGRAGRGAAGKDAPRESVTVLVDAENVRRSVWPNISAERLVELARAWVEAGGRHVVLVFDGVAPEGRGRGSDSKGVLVVGSGEESADDALVRAAADAALAGRPCWVVTSDRELRARVGADAERIIGGGAFARELEAAGR